MPKSPQKENGFTGIANETMDNLCKLPLSDYESRILHVIFRKTYGWNKKSDVISLSQFSNLTNIRTQHVARTIKELVVRNIIKVNYLTPQTIEYSFQKDYDLWDKKTQLDLVLESQLLPIQVVPNEVVPIQVVPNQVVPNEDTGTTYSGNQVVPKQVVTKEILQKQITKANNTKESKLFVLPNWIKENIWESFLEMRKTKKATPTEHAKDLIIKELLKLKELGNEPNAVLEQSTLNNYTDVYPLKNKTYGNNGHKPQGDIVDGKLSKGNPFANEPD